MENLPSLPNSDFELSITSQEDISLMPDPGFDYDDIKCQFAPEVPFYEKTDYAVAAASGALTALLDIFLVGNNSFTQAHQWGTEKVNDFVIKAAKTTAKYDKKNRMKITDLESAVRYLQKYELAADKAMAYFGGATQHHLFDVAHHPTIAGLFFSLLTQFSNGKLAFGVDKNGKFFSVDVSEKGVLIGENAAQKLLYGTVYWILHLISDMAGSSGSIGKRSGGTGIPGPLLSFMEEMAQLPLFKAIGTDKNGNYKFFKWLTKLFNGTAIKENGEGVRFDLRTELGIINQQLKHSLPVLANEMIVRGYFLVSRICVELTDKNIKSVKDLDKIDLSRIIPFRQRKLTRMLTISSGTFCAITTATTITKGVITNDYASMFLNLNYAGIYRFGIAIKSDYKYILEDTANVIEAAKQRELLRAQFYAEQNAGLSYFILNEQQSLLLESLKNQKLEYDITKSTTKSAQIKKNWQTVWLDSLKNIGISELITDEPRLYLDLCNEADRSSDKAWITLIALELYRFNPYYPFGISSDEDKRFKSVHLKSSYENDIFTCQQTYLDRSTYEELSKSIKHYETILTGSTKKAVAGAAGALVVGVISGGIAYAAAPAIAVALVGESFVGLSGAALTNASLAAIGGGSLAAGGLGMSGGTMIIAGGGGILSLMGGGGASATIIKATSTQGSLITECSSILAFTSTTLSKQKDGKERIDALLTYLYRTQKDTEADLAEMEASNSKEKDNKLIKATKSNLKYITITIKELEKIKNRKEK